ncbi:hypothetical protein V2J09_023339 [Rumex salicifolius]
MATLPAKSEVDIEQGDGNRSSASCTAGSRLCSDANIGEEILGATEEKKRAPSEPSSSSSVDLEVDLESGVDEEKSHSCKNKRNCRICHMSLDASNPDSGIPLELGCSCKNDLAAAHKHCAEAWFKIRGNKTCEICNSTALNIVGVNEATTGENWNDPNVPPANGLLAHSVDTRRFWQGNRFLNFLLACMVFAFVISWLFHFNVPS